jgi:hypothetical protein
MRNNMGLGGEMFGMAFEGYTGDQGESKERPRREQGESNFLVKS